MPIVLGHLRRHGHHLREKCQILRWREQIGGRWLFHRPYLGRVDLHRTAEKRSESELRQCRVEVPFRAWSFSTKSWNVALVSESIPPL